MTCRAGAAATSTWAARPLAEQGAAEAEAEAEAEAQRSAPPKSQAAEGTCPVLSGSVHVIHVIHHGGGGGGGYHSWTPSRHLLASI